MSTYRSTVFSENAWFVFDRSLVECIRAVKIPANCFALIIYSIDPCLLNVYSCHRLILFLSLQWTIVILLKVLNKTSWAIKVSWLWVIVCWNLFDRVHSREFASFSPAIDWFCFFPCSLRLSLLEDSCFPNNWLRWVITDRQFGFLGNLELLFPMCVCVLILIARWFTHSIELIPGINDFIRLILFLSLQLFPQPWEIKGSWLID